MTDRNINSVEIVNETDRLLGSGNEINNNDSVMPSDFNLRYCTTFVKKNNNLICAHCKKSRDEHENKDKIYDYVDNIYQFCTIKKPTDRYGEILLSYLKSNKAKFIRVEVDTEIENIAQYMLSKNGFKLEKPKLIISVTGGAKTLVLDNEISFALKKGLMKAARGNSAWIISGGTDYGVMRLVGDAVAEEFKFDDIPVIGIASYGCIYDEKNDFPKHDATYDPKEGTATRLNPNHSHFILVDDGSFGEFGVEVNFRTALEKFISEPPVLYTNKTYEKKLNKSTPMILIVVGGGPNTLKTILNAIRSKFPVILVEETCYAADFLIRIHRDRLSGELLSVDEYYQDLMKDDEFKNSKAKDHYKDIIQAIGDEINTRYINVFNVRKGGGKQSISPTIMEALSKVQADTYDKIKFGIKWDLYDTVRENLKNIPNEIDKQEKLERLLELALLEDSSNCAALLLDSDINFIKFCKTKRLRELYNHELTILKPKNKEPFILYLKKKNSGLNKVTTDHIKKFLEERFSTFKTTGFLPENFDHESYMYFSEQELNLFIWCILTNRIELAKLFWTMGKYQICYALMASYLLNFFASEISDLKERLEKSANEFEELAINLVKKFDENTRDVINDVLIIRYLKPIDMDCMELAVNCNCTRFMAEPTIQKALDTVWYGKPTYYERDMNPFENGLYKCQEKLNENPNYIFNNKNICKYDEEDGCLKRTLSRLPIPLNRCILHFISYLAFLALFSFVLLYKYVQRDYEESDEKFENESINSMNNYTNNSNTILASLREKVLKTLSISFYEIILLFWIITLLIEELRQFFSLRKFGITTFKDKIKNYFEDNWNIFDIVGLVLFLIGFILKLISLNSPAIFVTARIVLSVDLIVWSVRGLHFCLLVPKLGPKLVMIKIMMHDLKYFLIILATFVISFGIALEVITDATKENKAIGILNVAYWPIYGEIPLLEKIKDKCDGTKEDCVKGQSRYASYIILMIYLGIANVLLLNILIAMFNSTFERIECNSGVIWRNERYQLISEYTDAPIVPAPFSVFYYVWLIIDKLRKRKETNNNEIRKKNLQEIDKLMEYEQKLSKRLLNEMKYDAIDTGDNKISALNEKFELLDKRLRVSNRGKRSFKVKNPGRTTDFNYE